MKTLNTSAYDTALDASSRLEQFRTTYCNPADLNGGLEDFCDATPPERQNKDIDATRMLFLPNTLEMGFYGGGAKADEEDLMAFLVNFAGDDVINRTFNLNTNDLTEDVREDFMDFRHLKLLESIMMSAVIDYAARKTTGSGIADPEYSAMAENLGIDRGELYNEFGSDPSLYAQEEMLFNVAYNPNFYVKLYDKPENVSRVIASLDALELMALNRLIKSSEKSSILLASILNVGLKDMREEIESPSDN
jgi:hypothetical protein